jgi:starch-binding outer membrane protein, SusD/RagB family
MKPIKYILLLFFISTLISCKKFLDVKPKESISDQQTIFDKTSAEEAVRGIYSALADGNYYGTGFQSIGYLSGDNIVWTGSQSQIQEFINHKVSAENSTISGAWISIYRTISRANYVIAKVEGVNDPLLTTELKNQLIGEAYFLRALSYFDLARTWGGAPIIVNPTNNSSDNIGIPRSSQADTYAQALKDLETAEPLLPNKTNRFRATQKTVWALKARYYLYQNNWAKAEEYANSIIGDGSSYKLLKPYNSFFANGARGTEESVFEVFYNGTTEVNGHRGQWQPQTNGGTRQWAPNDAFVALVNDPLIGGNRNTLVAKDNQNRWYGNLYYRTPASDPSFVIRTAELYLIRAEARAQQNNLPGALSDLNAVRDRAGLAPSAAVSQGEILLAIENERRIEFALEPHRWFDLVRTNRATDVLNITDETKLLLPLPTQQLLLDKALVQNTGY